MKTPIQRSISYSQYFTKWLVKAKELKERDYKSWTAEDGNWANSNEFEFNGLDLFNLYDKMPRLLWHEVLAVKSKLIVMRINYLIIKNKLTNIKTMI